MPFLTVRWYRCVDFLEIILTVVSIALSLSEHVETFNKVLLHTFTHQIFFVEDFVAITLLQRMCARL
ncbi:hypothetical protein C6366_08170 [Desulfonatronum sp. SC1]|nr:hypothetical protein C6366_08170 [Desulfonatronum sp. SC1]